ncbi:MAG: SUF system NifU family Fe-S cluster assembly protein [Candidatus Omnitrophica bacterium]|nr:SUF system NifU family Fe-S cluster assembly protein [Candidatus Omnitrophota bacterium]MBI2105040.1 SUF system NifU family Fe-S cluster assembly protein [Candidatus Omnitrophota bacterium]
MVEQLDELYREVILEHFKNPTHSGELPDAQIRASGVNPLCGDELAFHVKLRDGRLERVRFRGKGCVISQAAASMLATQLEGKTVREAERIMDAMKGLMKGQEPDASADLGDLEALAGVRKFPVRIKCAALSWNVVEQGLEAHAHGGH